MAGNESIYPLISIFLPLTNSSTKKEGESLTYKGTDGYAPIFPYLGQEGYGINVELREGSVHCQNGTYEFLKQSILYARCITEGNLNSTATMAQENNFTVKSRPIWIWSVFLPVKLTPSIWAVYGSVCIQSSAHYGAGKPARARFADPRQRQTPTHSYRHLIIYMATRLVRYARRIAFNFGKQQSLVSDSTANIRKIRLNVLTDSLPLIDPSVKRKVYLVLAKKLIQAGIQSHSRW